MQKFLPVIRIILGLLITFSGLNKFGHWLNIAYMKDAMEFVIRLVNIGGGFIISTIAVLEILIGVSLLINKFTALSLAILLPLLVCIIIFHIFLDLKGIGVALLVMIMDLFLLYMNKDRLSVHLKTN